MKRLIDLIQPTNTVGRGYTLIQFTGFSSNLYKQMFVSWSGVGTPVCLYAVNNGTRIDIVSFAITPNSTTPQGYNFRIYGEVLGFYITYSEDVKDVYVTENGTQLTPTVLIEPKNQKRGNYISFVCSTDDPVISRIIGNGGIVIVSQKNGEKQYAYYYDLNKSSLQIEADANTEVSIFGDVTEFKTGYFQSTQWVDRLFAKEIEIDNNELAICYIVGKSNDGGRTSVLKKIELKNCASLAYLICENAYSISQLDLSKCPALISFSLGHANNFEILDLTTCKQLVDLSIEHSFIKELNLSENTDLNTPYFYNVYRTKKIYTRALKSGVASRIASLITVNASEHGTVYTNPNDPYYSTIETAANNSGWTIEQL